MNRRGPFEFIVMAFCGGATAMLIWWVLSLSGGPL